MHIRSCLFSLLLCLLIAHNAFGQSPFITNIYNRSTSSLNGYWKYIVDPYENGFYNYRYEPFENQTQPSKSAFFTNAKMQDKADLIEYDFDKMDSLLVPGDWNSQKERLYYYEGTVWYKKSFSYTKKQPDNRVFVYFGAVNYEADVYLNGQKLGKHIGGFTPFQFEITEQVEKDNFIVLKVDNKRRKNGVPTLNTDWWNYGGITRDVKIVETPETYIQDYTIQLSPDDPTLIEVKIKVTGTAKHKQSVTVSIPELALTKSVTLDHDGVRSFVMQADGLTYWSPETPQLYDISITTETDEVVDQIGFRSIRAEGKNILLNESPIFLKGISIHEESPHHPGRANSMEDAEKLLTWAKQLACNYVRLAHYPHNEYILRAADKLGIMVWEEIPVYWTIAWDDPTTYTIAESQLTELIHRDKNRASVIIWSMANETPTSEARTLFLGNLAAKTRAMDPTRLISAALEQHNYNGDPFTRTIDDPFAEMVDILSFNQYIGWYDGPIEKCRDINWEITQNKPVIISEFGAGAKYGLHGEKGERWTEEYQEYLYEETLQMIDNIDQLRGVSPWILVDFRSPRRVLPEIQDDYNRKGLISENGEKKKAFFVLQKYYQAKK